MGGSLATTAGLVGIGGFTFGDFMGMGNIFFPVKPDDFRKGKNFCPEKRRIRKGGWLRDSVVNVQVWD